MRIELASLSLELDSRGHRTLKTINHALGSVIQACSVMDVYLVDGVDGFLPGLAEEIFLDPIAQRMYVDTSAVKDILPDWDLLIEITFKPGVTNPEALTAREAIELAMDRSLPDTAVVQTARQYAFRFLGKGAGKADSLVPAQQIASLLHNSLIETASWITPLEWSQGRRFSSLYPHSIPPSPIQVEQISLEGLSLPQLEELSRKRLLSLSGEEMAAIQAYYQDPGVRKMREERGLREPPTDVELEMIAQTWSEHCKHKIFSAVIQYREPEGYEETIDSLFSTYIKETTRIIGQNRTDLRSVFHDNSGVVDFDEEHLVCMKVETHNSPSALDPYGGAITGIVGVNRDILGTGMGARPIFNTDVLCFGEPNTPPEEIPQGLIHPRRLLLGVHRGIVDGGNQSGIPTVAGAFLFDESFRGKPLVFCGTGGLLPRTVLGKPSWEKRIEPGDLAVMAGGRVGKDGIHGATFSSAALDESSPSSAVQIGDPITQKKLSDFLLEARDKGLYRALTDNGAGGLSSSLGEMAQLCGGVKIYLDQCPLKYSGLAPWEILVSESQERMSFAVPPESIEPFLALAKERGVEAAVVGEFIDSGLVEVYYQKELVGCLNLSFLHEGVPRMHLSAEWTLPERNSQTFSIASVLPAGNLRELFLQLLEDPNIASKESLVRQYDHEVQGGSIVKPFMGVKFDAPMDGAVLRPLYDSYQGLTVTHGIKPRYSDVDTYAMAVAAVDEAYRSHIALGGDPDRASALDNFCWPDPVQSLETPDGSYKMAQLVRACKGLQDACLAYQLPLISGKDSMKNDARIKDRKLSIRPTLLITLVGIIKDVRNAITTDFKQPGDRIYLLGSTAPGLGGSFLEKILGMPLGDLPAFRPEEAVPLYRVLHEALQKGWVASCHDISDGGLAVALGESCLGGRLGAEVTLDTRLIAGKRNDVQETALPQISEIEAEVSLLFGECPGRFLVSVRPGQSELFETLFQEYPCFCIGEVEKETGLSIRWEGNQRESFSLSLEEIEDSWKGFSREIVT